MKGDKPMTDKTDLPNPIEQKGECPLCHKPAIFEPIEFGTKRRYSCHTCISFLIQRADEKYISDLPQKDRIKISDEAKKCDPEDILLIYVKSRPPGQEVQLVRQPRRNWW